jgi:hypothetical protein
MHRQNAYAPALLEGLLPLHCLPETIPHSELGNRTATLGASTHVLNS